MNIDPATLQAEHDRARAQWPFIDATEAHYNLPRLLLYAVGSRETNLTNEVGDGGHGHGVWQLDDRSHTIAAGFDQDVATQAVIAASMLAYLLGRNGGQLRPALAAYNAGQGTVDYNLAHHLSVDSGTAGGDYSLDVAGRLAALQYANPAPNPMGEPEVTPEEMTEIKTFIKSEVDGLGAYLMYGGVPAQQAGHADPAHPGALLNIAAGVNTLRAAETAPPSAPQV